MDALASAHETYQAALREQVAAYKRVAENQERRADTFAHLAEARREQVELYERHLSSVRRRANLFVVATMVLALLNVSLAVLASIHD